MTGLVALCADATSLQHPGALGLSGECLTAQEWLRVFTSADEARRFLRTDRTIDEVWVASSDEVEPINLAATLKRDRADRCVCLLTFDGTGSLWSRASAAGIDASLTRQAFVARYGQRKRYAAAESSARTQAMAARRSDVEQRNRALSTLAGSAASPAAARGQAADVSPVMPPALIAASGPAAVSTELPWAGAAVPGEAAEAASAPDCPATRPRSAFLLPVVGGGGGVGKSTVAALCALMSQRRGLKTLLLDFDLQFGDMPRLLGVEDALAVDEALGSPGRLEHLAPEGRMPALLAAPKRMELSEVVSEQAPALLEGLMGRFDVIVANTGASWSECHAVLLERCSKALFVVDQRPSSIESCKRALDLCMRCGIATSPFAYAVNRCSKRSLFSPIDVANTLQVQRVYELADGGREVEELLGAGMAGELVVSRNPLCASVGTMLDELLPKKGDDPEGAEARQAKSGLLGRRSRRHGGGAS